MTIAIQRSASFNTVFFDAVITYTESYQSKLTSNPIDGAETSNGSHVVNDHVVSENPSYNVKGVISGADFFLSRPANPKLNIVNTGTAPDPVTVNTLPFGEAVVTLSDGTGSTTALAKEELINIRNSRESISLHEFTGSTLNRSIENLVITNLQFSEDVSSGDALSVEMTLQQANFVTLKTSKVTRQIGTASGAMKDKAQAAVSKGAQTKKETIYREGVSKLSEKASAALSNAARRLKDGNIKDVLLLLQESL